MSSSLLKQLQILLPTIVISFIIGYFVNGKMMLLNLNKAQEESIDMEEESVNDSSIPISTEEIKKRSIYQKFSTFSTHQPWQLVELNPVRNSTVKLVSVAPGKQVKKGDILALLDSDLQSHKKKLADLQLKLATSDFNITKQLVNKKFVSESEFQRKSLELKISKLRRKVESIENSQSVMKSPIDGVVSHIGFKQGDYIARPEKFKLRIVDISKYLATIRLPQNIASAINLETSIEVSKGGFGESNSIIGEIFFLSPEIDSKSGTVRMDVEIAHPPKEWLSGMVVKIDLILAASYDSLTIPNHAIIEKNDKKIIFVVEIKDGIMIAKKIEPTFGIDDGRFTEIIGDFYGDQKLIVKGQRSLNDGVHVRVINNE
ncbi:MAG: efflux RND transporter periplasmic adaptor subunit [Oligoflexales bacterium]